MNQLGMEKVWGSKFSTIMHSRCSTNEYYIYRYIYDPTCTLEIYAKNVFMYQKMMVVWKNLTPFQYGDLENLS